MASTLPLSPVRRRRPPDGVSPDALSRSLSALPLNTAALRTMDAPLGASALVVGEDVFDRAQRVRAQTASPIRRRRRPDDGRPHAQKPRPAEEAEVREHQALYESKPRTPWRLIRPKSRCGAHCASRTPLAREAAGRLNAELDRLLAVLRVPAEVPAVVDVAGEHYDRSVSNLEDPKHRAFDVVLTELLRQAEGKTARLAGALGHLNDRVLLPVRLEADRRRQDGEDLGLELERTRGELARTAEELREMKLLNQLMLATRPSALMRRKEREQLSQQSRLMDEMRNDLMATVARETRDVVEAEFADEREAAAREVAALRRELTAQAADNEAEQKKLKKRIKQLLDGAERMKKKSEIETEKYQGFLDLVIGMLGAATTTHEATIESAFGVVEKLHVLATRVNRENESTSTAAGPGTSAMAEDDPAAQAQQESNRARIKFADVVSRLRQRLTGVLDGITLANLGASVDELGETTTEVLAVPAAAIKLLGAQVNRQLIRYNKLLHVDRAEHEVQTTLLGVDIEEVMGTGARRKRNATGAKYKDRSAYVFFDEETRAALASGERLSGELRMMADGLAERQSEITAQIKTHLVASKNGPIHPVTWSKKNINAMCTERVRLGAQVRKQLPVEFCFDYCLRNYGLPSLAKRNLGVFIKNVNRLKNEDAFVKFFHRLLWELPLDLFNFFAEAWAMCVDWDGRTLDQGTIDRPVFPEDDNGGPNWVELSRASAIVYSMFPAMPRSRAEAFTAWLCDQRQRGETPLFLAQKRHVAASLCACDRVPRNEFLMKLVEEKMFEEQEQHRFFCILFVEGDDNGDGVLDWGEMEELVTRVNPALTVTEITTMFREAVAHPFNEDSDEDALAPEAFSAVARSHGLHYFLGRRTDGSLAPPWELFDLYADDTLGDPVLGLEGMQRLLADNHIQVAFSDVEAAVERIMTDKEDFLRLSYREFSKWWGSPHRFAPPFFSNHLAMTLPSPKEWMLRVAPEDAAEPMSGSDEV